MPKKREVKPLLLESQTQKRRDRAQELRSARRQGALAKRRKFDPARTAATTPVGDTTAFSEQQSESWTEEQLEVAVQGVKKSPIAQILPHLVALRKLLSLEDPPVEEVVQRDHLAPKLIQLLSVSNDEIQIEATWCLTNIASSWTRHAQKILGATPQLISFLAAPNPVLQEQALWALGNIAGDSSEFREMLHANGALLPIFRLLQQPPTAEIARTAAWAISNLARGDKTPGAPFLQVAPNVIAALGGNTATGAPRDNLLRVEAAWVLAFLTAKENETAWALVRAGMVPAVVEAFVESGGKDPLCTPALRALGNMVSGAEEWADAVMVHKQFLPCLDAVLKSQDKLQRALVKEAAWVASNVAAGRREHREALVAQGSTTSLTMLLLSDQLDLQQEAAYGIWNMVSHDQNLLLQAASNDKIIEAYTGLVRTQSPPAVRCALSFLQLVCQNVPGGPRIVEQAGGLEAIDDVHYGGQTDPDLREAAGAIVDKFFGEEGYDSSDEEEADTQGGGFSFKGGRGRGSGSGPSHTTSSSSGTGPSFQFSDSHAGHNSERAASSQQQQQQQQQSLPSMGRGAHLTRPAWMNQSPPC